MERASLHLLVLLLISSPLAGLACDCMNLLIEEKVDRATHIFLGRVTGGHLSPVQSEAGGSGGELVQVRFDIISVLKGTPGEIDSIYTDVYPNACGVPIVVGLQYVFFVDERGSLSACGGTMPQSGISFGNTGDWLEFVRRYGLADY